MQPLHPLLVCVAIVLLVQNVYLGWLMERRGRLWKTAKGCATLVLRNAIQIVSSDAHISRASNNLAVAGVRDAVVIDDRRPIRARCQQTVDLAKIAFLGLGERVELERNVRRD